MAVIKYENVRLRETTKTGKLKRDERGYYDVILGAMNCHNSLNEFYTLKGAEDIFNGSSIYHRRVTSGKLYGEHGHPKRNNMTKEEYYRRLLEIREERYGTFIKSVELDDTLWKKYPGLVTAGAVLIMGKVMPYGELKDVVEDGLSNPDINFAYSVRSFTKDHAGPNGIIKVMVECVTWDSVGANGVAIAEKYNSPALESDSEDVDIKDLIMANRCQHLEDVGSSLENNYGTYDQLLLHADSMEEAEEVYAPRKKIWWGM